MSVSVVVGAQWGDEGKGKVVDYLSQSSDIIVRFQGGDNAGHTVSNKYGTFKLHLIPCGIFNSNAISLIGTGTVVNPDVLIEEMEELKAKGFLPTNLRISGKAHILMPYHVDLDSSFEEGNSSIGTTKRGIGPVYADKAYRFNLRFEDLLDMEYLRKTLSINLPRINKNLECYGTKQYNLDELIAKCQKWSDYFREIIIDAHSFLHNALTKAKNILFEGQLGTMKDIDLGVYPYVTSSNPLAAYAAVSSGIPMSKFDNLIGVAKAFSSAVGKGPFPTELSYDETSELRGTGENIDDEFGARTGRPRRLGWLDLPILKYAHKINGFNKLALCKLDKLDSLKEIKVCIGYKLDGKEIDYMPNTRELEKVEPIYETFEGWMVSTKNAKSFDELPENAKKYIRKIEEFVGVKIHYIGIGPGRNDIICR